MSDGEVEVEAPQQYPSLPKDVAQEIGQTKLFNKWSYEDVEIRDISLTDYIQIRQPVYMPHSAGRYAVKRFRKAQCPIIERLTNSLMMNGRNNGKKLMAVRIVAHAFEIIHIMTDQNPIQVAVDAIVNCGPREDAIKKKDELERVAKSNSNSPSTDRLATAAAAAAYFACGGVTWGTVQRRKEKGKEGYGPEYFVALHASKVAGESCWGHFLPFLRILRAT